MAGRWVALPAVPAIAVALDFQMLAGEMSPGAVRLRREAAHPATCEAVCCLGPRDAGGMTRSLLNLSV